MLSGAVKGLFTSVIVVNTAGKQVNILNYDKLRGTQNTDFASFR